MVCTEHLPPPRTMTTKKFLPSVHWLASAERPGSALVKQSFITARTHQQPACRRPWQSPSPSRRRLFYRNHAFSGDRSKNVPRSAPANAASFLSFQSLWQAAPLLYKAPAATRLLHLQNILCPDIFNFFHFSVSSCRVPLIRLYRRRCAREHGPSAAVEAPTPTTSTWSPPAGARRSPRTPPFL